MQIKADITDRQLIDDYRRTENASAIETLFLRYHHIVYLVCYKYLKNEEESKDAVMDIFHKLLIDCKKYNISNFRAWLYTVAKNHCLMKIRTDKRLNVQYIPSDEIDTLIMENDDFVNLRDGGIDIPWDVLLSSLSTEQKTCVELFYFKKKSYKEIAQINGMDIRQIKSHIQNGKRNLKNLLKKRTGGTYVFP
jgi:RNA polymerase sigma factor (sigma-70 family)